MMHSFLHQSPTGHPNQIITPFKDVVSQYLQIIHKSYRNLSSRGHKQQKAPIEDN